VDDRDLAEFMAAAQACMSRGAWEEARALARKRLAFNPGERDAALVLIRSFIGEGDAEQALATLREFDLSDGQVAGLYRGMAELFYDRGDWEKACYYYEKCLAQLSPPQVARAWKRAVAEISLQAEGEPEEVRQVPQDFQTMTLVDLYVRQGHLKEALKVLESMREKDPANEAVIERIRGVQALMGEEVLEEKREHLLAELDRWLQNIYKPKAAL